MILVGLPSALGSVGDPMASAGPAVTKGSTVKCSPGLPLELSGKRHSAEISKPLAWEPGVAGPPLGHACLRMKLTKRKAKQRGDPRQSNPEDRPQVHGFHRT